MQNPVANLISVPFQNNTNVNTRPLNETQSIRNILRLIRQPDFCPGPGTVFGRGDTQGSAFLSPAGPGPGGLIWGASAIAQMPTNTSEVPGSKNRGLGPTAVVLKREKGDPWVCGALAAQHRVVAVEQRAWRQLQ